MRTTERRNEQVELFGIQSFQKKKFPTLVRVTCFPIVSVPAWRKWSSQGTSVQGRKPVPPSSAPYRCTVSPGQHNHQSIPTLDRDDPVWNDFL